MGLVPWLNLFSPASLAELGVRRISFSSMRLSLLLALLLATSSCTLFDEPAERAERSIDTAVLAFQNERQRFPRDLDELQAFAAGRLSLDTAPFSEVRFAHPTPEVLHVYLAAESPDRITVTLSYAVTYSAPY